MAEQELSIELAIAPGAGVEVSRGIARRTFECVYTRRIPSAAERTPRLVEETLQGELDSELRGSVLLVGIETSRPVEVRFLSPSGATRLVRTLDVAAEARRLSLELAKGDVAIILAGEPRPDPETALVSRHAVFVKTGQKPVEFDKSKLSIAPLRVDAQSWSALGLAELFKTEAPATVSVEHSGEGLSLGAFAWAPVHLAVDGRFEVTFEKQAGNAWIWWLVGPSSALGVVLDALTAQAPRVLSVALPPFSSGPGADAGADGADGCGRPVPADVSEAELVNNPGVYGEDPGAFCKPFANPARILSERAFHVVLRAEQPVLSGEASVVAVDPPLLELDPKLVRSPAPATGLIARIGRAVTEGLGTTDVAALAAERTRVVAGAWLPEKYREFLRVAERGRVKPNARQPLNWEGDASRYQATTVTLGHILEFRVRWRSNGYSLGNVVSTLTLAPRQVKRIQKIQWERAERTRRSERTELADRVADSVVRERTYEDEVKASLSEWARGESEASTSAGAAGIGFALPGFVVGGGGAHSNASSSSSQEGGRRTSASEEQRLRDSIRRFADALRRLESTVIEEVAQEETVTGTTEVLRNQNYAHSLTVLYYQILRHLRVDTEFAGVRECLFVPFAIRPFTLERTYRWRDTLRRGLKDKRLLPAFEHLRDVMNGFADSDIPPGQRSEQPVRHVFGSLYLRLAIERPKDGAEAAFDPARWAVLAPFLGVPALGVWTRLVKLAEEERDRTFQAEQAPRVAAAWVDTLTLQAGSQALRADFTLASRYQFNGVVRVDFSAPVGTGQTLTRETLASLRVRATRDLPPGSVANLGRVSFTYQTDSFERTVGVDQGAGDLVSTETGVRDTAGAVVSVPPDGFERRNLRAEIARAAQDLLQHLNENVEHYHKVIWWNMDRDRLYMLLDGAYVPRTNGVSVASVVERDPVAILGNCLVFRVSSGSFLGMGDLTTPQALYDYFASRQNARAPMYVSLPNDGVYAQTIMDSCEALEEHFGNTDWALGESEPDLGTIAPELLTSRRAEPPSTTPTTLPQTIINLQNAPDAPAPSGLAGVLGAVTNANAFRDFAGLAGTQENVRAGLSAATSLAQTFGNQAAALRLAEMAAKADAAKNTDQKLASVKRAVDKGLTDAEKAEKHTNKILEELHSPSTATRLHQDSPMVEAVRAALQRPGSTIEATSSDGSVKVALAKGDEEEEPDTVELDLVETNEELEGVTVKDDERWIVLFAGYNYQARFSKSGASHTYGQYARNRAELLLKKNPSWADDDSVHFLLFNVGEGAVYVDERAKGRLRDKSNWKQIYQIEFANSLYSTVFKAVDPDAHYEETEERLAFIYPIEKNGDEEIEPGMEAAPIMSILHFYQLLREFGRQAPGSVYEASILSHAGALGPILLNSWQREPYGYEDDPLNIDGVDRPRDPLDVDGRADCDFFGGTHTAQDLVDMGKAFRSDGYIWLWGCSAAPVFKRLVLRLAKQDGYEKDGSSADTEEFDLDFESTAYVEKLRKAYKNPSILPSSGTTTRATLADIKAFLRVVLGSLYAQRFAQAVNVPCIAGALGTGSQPDSHNKPLVVHYVPKLYFPVVNFYDHYLSLDPDAEGRRYVTYTKI